jgi:ribosomal protein L18E
MTKKATCNCPMMAQMSQAHMKGMRDTDARLNSLVDVMETTSGERKADATSSIVKILVEGRASTHKMMMADNKPMMADMKGGSCNCPMMAQMSPESMRKTHETTARIESLFKTMESSSGDRKADATSSIVKILVEERATMHKMMMAGK